MDMQIRMWETYPISCITYHKIPDAAWPEEWFIEQEVAMPRGETVTIRMAEWAAWSVPARMLWACERFES